MTKKSLFKETDIGFVGYLHIGGYQVCEKWLKDRCKRELSAEDIVHYGKVVVSLRETIRIMKEVDGVIESAGGWSVK